MWQGRVSVVRVLLARGARVNEIGLLGQTALHIAAYTYSFGTLEIARALVAAGADVDAPGEQGGSTPLHTAVSGTCFHLQCCCRLFLMFSVCVLVCPSLGLGGNVSMVLLLLHFGADPLYRNRSGNTPLAIARRAANLSLLRILERHLCGDGYVYTAVT